MHIFYDLLIAASLPKAELNDWPHWKLIFETVREGLLIIGLFLGVLWAVWRYIFIERNKAQAEKARMESPPYLNTDIVCNVIEHDGLFDLVGDVTIFNPGHADIKFDLTALPPICITRVIADENGDFTLSEDVRLPALLATGGIDDCILEGQGTASLKFISRFSNPQICLVEFTSEIISNIPELAQTKAVPPPNRNWKAIEIVHIGIPPKPSPPVPTLTPAHTG
jgi:hypothetical protein